MYFLGDVSTFARPKGSKDKQKRKKRLLNSPWLTGAALIGGVGLGTLAGRQLMKMRINRRLAPHIKQLDEEIKIAQIRRSARSPEDVTRILAQPPTAARKLVERDTAETTRKALTAAGLAGGAISGIVPMAVLSTARGYQARKDLIRRSRQR